MERQLHQLSFLDTLTADLGGRGTSVRLDEEYRPVITVWLGMGWTLGFMQ